MSCQDADLFSRVEPLQIIIKKILLPCVGNNGIDFGLTIAFRYMGGCLAILILLGFRVVMMIQRK